MLAELRARLPDAFLAALSADPAGTASLHAVEAWPRAPFAVWQALARARLLISGGGSLVQDVTSARSALYYLGTIAAASARGVPVAVVGQGIGPIRRSWIRGLARRAFDRVGAISVRDGESALTLAALGVVRPVHRGADLAVLASPAPSERVRALLARSGLDATASRVGVAARSWPGLMNPSALGEEVRRFAADRRAAVAVFPFDRVRDRAVSHALAAASGGCVVDLESPQDLLGFVGALDLIVGVRLHALVFAASQGVPAIGLAYDPKVSAFASEQGLPYLPAGASAAALRDALATTWDRRQELRARLNAGRPALRRAAAAAVGVAVDLLAAAPVR